MNRKEALSERLVQVGWHFSPSAANKDGFRQGTTPMCGSVSHL